MKMTMSGATLLGLAGVVMFGLALEGAKSLVGKYNLEARVANLEQMNQDILDKQNYIFELLAGTTQPSTPVVGTSAIQVEKTGRTVAHEDLDMFCLAKNIFHEAGVEDELGMFAVAQVTINRVRNANYPSKICDVVMQPAQFSWANDKKRRWTHPTGSKWEMAKRIANQVIKEGYRVPALQSAMFYHADYSKPSWRDPSAVVAQVGTHIFYASAR
jgi:spore germination cell wall hydrolase CwlJ-like protein